MRAAIVENRYPPGQRLVEQRIAEELGLSRTPVREALRMLEAEGLVVSERNRGAMVRPLSTTEVVDLYGLRIRLESYAVEVATERATEAELGELVAAADAFSEIRRTVDVDTVEGVRLIHEANRRFHDAIITAARHRRLATMLARTVDIPLVFQAFRTFGAAEIERSDTFHHLIAEAMCRRDATPRRRADGRAHRPGPRRRARRDGGRREGRTDRCMTVDTEHRRLCHALFDALEAGDVAGVDACYAPDMTMWINVSGETITREANLEAVDKGRGMHRRRLYNDRNINTFDDGFVVQYTTHVVAHNGTEVPLSACLVAEVRDGKISKLFEYLDTTQFRSRAKTR